MFVRNCGMKKKVGFQVRDIMIVGEINLTVNYALPLQNIRFPTAWLSEGCFEEKNVHFLTSWLSETWTWIKVNIKFPAVCLSGTRFNMELNQHLMIVIRQGISPYHMRTHRKTQDNSVLSSLLDITAIHGVQMCKKLNRHMLLCARSWHTTDN